MGIPVDIHGGHQSHSSYHGSPAHKEVCQYESHEKCHEEHKEICEHHDVKIPHHEEIKVPKTVCHFEKHSSFSGLRKHSNLHSGHSGFRTSGHNNGHNSGHNSGHSSLGSVHIGR